MARDAITEKAFTTADDAMQGLWGLQTYIRAAVLVADKNQVGQRLPKKAFNLTHEWKRYYDPKQLIVEMGKVGEHVVCRMCLVNLVAVFEAAIKQFHQRLEKRERQESTRDPHYKTLLKWTFKIVRENPVISPAARARLPETCGDVDNARRLRNLIVHNNARYHKFYKTDAIDDKWVMIRHEPNSEDAIEHATALLLSPERLEHFSRSHIELLHILHNTIQSKFFNHPAGFNYLEEGKAIEWHRILSG
ncbi:MAG: hypothetical protein ABSA59_22710 [Terriglobia bacterium]|jgi:hypothetical protein